MNINELMQKKAGLHAQMRQLLDKAAAEKRDMNDAENTQYVAIEKDFDGVCATIAREEKLAKATTAVREIIRPGARNKEKVDALAFTKDPEYLQAFEGYARYGISAATAPLETGNNGEGGYIVPQEYETQLITSLTAQVAIRQLASVISTSSTRNIPIEVSHSAAGWVDEEGGYGEDEPSFDRATISAWKLGNIIKVSDELLQDAFFNLPGYISTCFARAFGEAEETAFVTGDGTKKPTGLAVTSTKGVDSASKTLVVADELFDLFHSVNPFYRRNGNWLMKDSTAKLLRKVKDSTGQYIWQPGLQAGAPDTLIGKPVNYSDSVDAMAASKKIIFFGDFKQYMIADRAGIQMLRLNELYAANGQVGFRCSKRTDGKLLVADAVKHILTSA